MYKAEADSHTVAPFAEIVMTIKIKDTTTDSRPPAGSVTGRRIPMGTGAESIPGITQGDI